MPTSPRVALLVSLGLASLLLCAHSLAFDFVTDDAFISFVYAKNLVEHGALVFNLGERVEGYTNFLWTVILAGAIKLGLDPVLCAKLLGAASAFAALVGAAGGAALLAALVFASMPLWAAAFDRLWGGSLARAERSIAQALGGFMIRAPRPDTSHLLFEASSQAGASTSCRFASAYPQRDLPWASLPRIGCRPSENGW